MPKNRRKIKDDLVAIIENEAPISTDYLFRRILTAYGVRSGVKTRAIIDNLLADLGYKITGDGVLFVWNDRTTQETVTQYRYSRLEDSRDFQDIPEEELLVAVREVIRKNVSLPEADLVREVAKAFCFTRMTPLIEEAVKKAAERALKEHVVAFGEGGKYMTVS